MKTADAKMSNKIEVYRNDRYVLIGTVYTYPATILRKQHVKFPNKKTFPWSFVKCAFMSSLV